LLDIGDLSTTPIILDSDAQEIAIGLVVQDEPDFAACEASVATLMIYHPSVVGNVGPTQLVWQIIVTSEEDPYVSEFILVDAHTGEIALRYSLIKNIKYRRIYDADSSDVGTLRREEGDPPYGQVDVDDAYDYLGDTYDFYSSYHGRDSIDNAGMTMKAFVRVCFSGEPCPFPNAFWSSQYEYMVFGEGYAVDDVTGHELTHGVTDYESSLVYLNESGAINESFSDMWGEWIDQTNGRGNDSSIVQWLMGEDLPGGASRDMADPTTYYDPDRMGSPYWYTGSADNGGVHTNSGVGNKLCYLLTDGDTFNGHIVTGMGISKVADLFYEVQTNLLLSGADYADLYVALTQASINLGWSTAEKQNLEQACQAVEITSGPGYCAASGGGYEYISSVEVGTINNTVTGSGNYVDYTYLSTTMERDSSYAITITNGNPYSSDQCGIWIDWNQDLDFGDFGETITISNSPGTGPYSATITVPIDAVLGNTRMRIRIMYTGTLNSCGSTTYGEVEDYTVNVSNSDTTPPTVTDRYPLPGSTITATNINLDVIFSEPVTGVDATDMVLSGIAAVDAFVETPTDQGGNTWRFPISSLNDGTLEISLAPDSGDIEDNAGNDLAIITWNYTINSAEPQALPYLQDFSSGLPDGSIGWEYFSSDSGGRIEVINGRLRMDRSSSGTYTLNEAILHMDFTGQSNIILSFFQAESGDEPDYLPEIFVDHDDGDGVLVSNDGITWQQIVNANTLDVGSGGQVFTVNLDTIGIPYTSNYRIKFQQYDNYPWSSDGREFDNIEIKACNVTGDFDHDCYVDISDLNEFIIHWLDECSEGGCGQADINGDNIVNLADLSKFAEHWLEDYGS